MLMKKLTKETKKTFLNQKNRFTLFEGFNDELL